MSNRIWFILALAATAVACSSSNDSRSSDALGGFPGCVGKYNTKPSPTGQYVATDFGCSSSPYYTDPSDVCGSADCIASAYDQGVCDSGQSKADCQRTVNWYSIGGARYGCGARLQVTNPKNGKSVVVMVLDDGPSCYVENKAGCWVLDVSYPTIKYLFGQEEGYSDHAVVDAVVVGSSTPLGPVQGNVSPPPPPPDGGTTSNGVACNTDGDCNPGNDGSGKICQSGVCVPGCNANWQCPGSETCIGGQCGSASSGNAPPQGGCSHSLCSSGDPLDQGCDAAGCTNTICDPSQVGDEYCCSTQWDSQCMQEVTDYCAPYACN